MKIRIDERYKILHAICTSILKDENKTLFICNGEKSKDDTYKKLLNATPKDVIEDNENFIVKFKNGSTIECMCPKEFKVTRGKRAEINPFLDPCENCIDKEMLDKVLKPFQAKLTFWQKIKLKLFGIRRYKGK